MLYRVLIGTIEYARDPDGQDKILLLNSVSQFCATKNVMGEKPLAGEIPALYRVFGERDKLDASYMLDAFAHVSPLEYPLRFNLCDLKSNGHAQALEQCLVRVQTVGVRVLDAARLLIDKEIYLQERVQHAALAYEKAEEAGEVGVQLKALEASVVATAELNAHTSILENEHHERMDLEQLHKSRLLLSQTWKFCLLDSADLNAFVVATQPRLIYATVPLVLMCQNDDELVDSSVFVLCQAVGWVRVRVCQMAQAC